jgi:hypothetical protein
VGGDGPRPTTRSGKRWVGTFATHRDGKDAEADVRKQVRRQHGRMACDEFANTWIDRYPRRRESTNIGYRERISKFANDFACRQLDQVTRMEARAWALANPGRVHAVRAMFSDAARDGLVADNPFANLRLREPDGRRHLSCRPSKSWESLSQPRPRCRVTGAA